VGNQISAGQLKEAFLAGASLLNEKKELINELNVFPVPDGDTGTNMTMTILSAAREVADIEEPDIENVTKAMAGGSLRGARGNSGVILSQLIRGFTKELRESGVIDAPVLARAFNRAVETAYRAVMKPKEGTILTVAKGVAERMTELAVSEEGLIPILEKVLEYGDEVLEKTPELLPVLKEAGVVDSGGKGLMTVLYGALLSLKGEKTELKLELGDPGSGEGAPLPSGEGSRSGEISTADIRFGYCTEFMINGEHEFREEEVEALRSWLEGVGDSIVCFSDGNIIKVHVHTNHPGNAFEKGLSMGYLSKMKVDNMRLEHNERLIRDASRIAAMQSLEREKAEEEAEEKDFAFLAVCAGEGLSEVFKGIGADRIISGGQTMNPSTEDILKAAEGLRAKHIFILPNNKNIVLAANQAAALSEGGELHVIPSLTIPQGISAMIAFSPDMGVEENEKAMKEAMSKVSSAEVTYAVRNTVIEGRAIAEGNIICIGDRGLLSVSETVQEAVSEALNAMLRPDSEIITLYYGEDVREEEAEQLAKKLREEHPEQELELQPGGQPVYYYFISVE